MLDRRRFLTLLGLVPLAPAAAAAAARLVKTPEVKAETETETRIPVGTICQRIGPAPDGWLPCDGRYVSVKEHPTLYAAIGQAYGVHPAAAAADMPLPVSVRAKYESGRLPPSFIVKV